MRRTAKALEKVAGKKIAEDDLWISIDLYNHTRDFLGKIYELRKRDIPPLSGAEVLGIMTSAMIMPKEEFNNKIEELLPYIENRENPLSQQNPRILISSEELDHPGYLKIAEESCLIVMDDMNTGIRYIDKNVDSGEKDPFFALAERYLGRHGSSRMADWDAQFAQVMEWIKEYRIDGVLSLPLTWCYPQIMRLPFYSRQLKEEGIPNISVNREYHLANEGQLRTRIGAFIEMLTLNQ